jgi:hypothetical protein
MVRELKNFIFFLIRKTHMPLQDHARLETIEKSTIDDEIL